MNNNRKLSIIITVYLVFLSLVYITFGWEGLLIQAFVLVIVVISNIISTFLNK